MSKIKRKKTKRETEITETTDDKPNEVRNFLPPLKVPPDCKVSNWTSNSWR